VKHATITLPLKGLRKLKKKLKKALQEIAFHKEKRERAEEMARSAHKSELSMVEVWDQHSHQICDALGDEYYSDDGAGFIYENMVKGIMRLREEVAKQDALRTELRELRELLRYARKWSAQGSRSRWSTRASLGLWDKVKDILDAEAAG
jgi:hypothetical protein